MEYLIAKKLQEEWGDRPCDHPALEKETYVGAFLITWVCTTCGKEFTIAEKLEMYQSRKRKSRIRH
jgi:hypothetical protein